MDFSKLDSQHFWDMMDSLPEDKIGNIELNLLIKIKKSMRDLGMDVNKHTIVFDRGCILEYVGIKNKPLVNYQIELMDEQEEKLFEALLHQTSIVKYSTLR